MRNSICVILFGFSFLSCNHSKFEKCLEGSISEQYKEKIENFESFLVDQNLIQVYTIDEITNLIENLNKKDEMLKFKKLITDYNSESFSPSEFSSLEGCCSNISIEDKPIRLCEVAIEVSKYGVTIEGLQSYLENLSNDQYKKLHYKGLIYSHLFYLGQ